MKIPFVSICIGLFCLTAEIAMGHALPYLDRKGESIRLIVDGKPYLARGGELANSVASNLDHLDQYWDKFRTLNMNTLVAPVYWDLIEPREGEFDFSLVNGLIKSAQKHEMKLVLLWFGSWKNSMSSYCPEWVKTDFQRFPRARNRDGRAMEILSPFYEINYQADANAFRALMRHIRQHDKKQTVIMVQPENEIGMVELAREYGERANSLYQSAVPNQLMNYLVQHRNDLTAELLRVWSHSNFKAQGTWTEIFGDTAQTEELFMAWHFAYYTEQVARAGKEEYPIPMFVNAALIRPGYEPGQYVSAGPLPHLIDIWRAAAPSIDFIAPDIYFPNFVEWTERYTRSGNPLFIPEALRNEFASVNALYAVGEHNAIGFSPFGIESISGPAASYLSKSYDILRQLEPLISTEQTKRAMRGLLQISDEQRAPQQIRLGHYEMHVSFEYATPPPLADGVINESHDISRGPRVPAGGLVLQLSDDEFIFAGIGLTITFDSLDANEEAGIVSAATGVYQNGKWKTLLWNNGDQTHQGRHVRLVPGEFTMQKVRLYRYR
jgi:Beta-galactosidase